MILLMKIDHFPRFGKICLVVYIIALFSKLTWLFHFKPFFLVNEGETY